jgi:hypothetical protein
VNSLSNESLSFPVILVIVSVGFLIIFTNSFLQNTLAFEENLVILQTGIILTAEGEYAISNNFQTRIVQDGKIIRISGVTTTGEIFYAYQKTIDKGIILKGKILHNDRFIPIIKPIQVIDESLTDESQISQPIKMVILQPQSTYWRQIYSISVKVFEEDKNPRNDYWYKSYLVPNVPILIEINYENGRHLTTIEGITDDNGYFRGQYQVKDNLDWAGKYIVRVIAGDESFSTTQDLTTFIIGEVIGTRNSTGG